MPHALLLPRIEPRRFAGTPAGGDDLAPRPEVCGRLHPRLIRGKWHIELVQIGQGGGEPCPILAGQQNHRRAIVDMRKLRRVFRHHARIAVAPFVRCTPKARPGEERLVLHRQPGFGHPARRSNGFGIA